MNSFVISNTQADYFLYEVEKKLSSHYHAGIICDKDGFIISSRIPKKNSQQLRASEIALTAIADKKKKEKNSEYVEVIRDLDDNSNVLLVLLLKRDRYDRILNQYRELNKILTLQDIF